MHTFFLVGLAISEGVRLQANISVEQGADIYVTGDQFGSNGPIQVSLIEDIKRIDGVVDAIPRIVGRTYFGGRIVIIVGLLNTKINDIEIIKGKRILNKGDVIVGEALSREFDLRPGVAFTLSQNPEVLFKVAGIFRSDRTPIWSANMILMSFEDAGKFFKQEGMASQILIHTRPGYSKGIAQLIQQDFQKRYPKLLLRVQDKDLVKQYFKNGFNKRAGIFTVFYIIAFGLSIPILMVSSGFGLKQRKTEIGILKATGWKTVDIMEVIFLENIYISIIAVSISVIIAYVWLKFLNGIFISQFFIPDIGLIAPFPIPFNLIPSPVLLGAVFSIIITSTGSLYSTWRASIIPPYEAMR